MWTPIPPWIGDDSSSDWIIPDNANAPARSAGDADGYYTYQISFNLPTGDNPNTVSISGQWAADAEGVNIYVNGTPSGQTATGFDSWTSFTLSIGFKSGLNTLDFVVDHNSMGPTAYDYTGVRVEFSTICAQAQATSTTTVTSSANSSVSGQPVTFTATGTCSCGCPPVGTVSFYDGSTSLGTALISNHQATYTTATLPVGTDAITAVYSGDSECAGGTSAVYSQTVNMGITTTSLAPWTVNQPGYSQTITASGGTAPLTYTVTPTPTGAPLTEVPLGSDYLQTQPGTSYNFGGSIGVVNFTGLPIGPGLTDTIVQRQQNAFVAPGGTAAPIPIQLVALSLESTAPVNVGGSFFDVFVTLDPSDASTGTMTIAANAAGTGGTFNATLDVYFDATFVPTGSGTTMTIPGEEVFNNTGSSWSSTITAGTAVAAGAVGDQNANQHWPLSRGQVDFYPNVINEIAPGRGARGQRGGAGHHVGGTRGHDGSDAEHGDGSDHGYAHGDGHHRLDGDGDRRGRLFGQPKLHAVHQPGGGDHDDEPGSLDGEPAWLQPDDYRQRRQRPLDVHRHAHSHGSTA